MLEPNIKLESGTILITGAAGFIGANLVLELLNKYSPVHLIGIDNLNNYDVSIKEDRLQEIEKAAAVHKESS